MAALSLERVTAMNGPAFFDLRRASIPEGCSGYYPEIVEPAWKRNIGRGNDPMEESAP